MFIAIGVQSRTHIAVIGAGVFGGWVALYLLRRNARVTLIDAWGPGNSRSSSGGETRIMRGTYGPNQPYTKMAAHALRLWKEHETQWGLQFLHRAGVLWMVTSSDDQFERSSLSVLRDAGIAYEELSGRELSRRWPQINIEDVRWAIYEPEGGFLSARFACQAIAEQFVKAGGEYRQVVVLPYDLENGVRNGITLSDGSKLTADHYVFACGPWLGKLFP
jgi:glycine/D-amino acid oxidase-like deaminating enzyme